MYSLPKISVIFPNYNGGKEPLECLRSVKKLNYPKHLLQTIVVDNGSKDGSSVKIKKQFPDVKLIKNAKNEGFARAINQGIKAATGKLIFITNDDVIFEKNSLKIASNYLLSHPDVGIVGGKILFKNKPCVVCSSGFTMNKWTGNVHVAPYPNKAKQPDWVQGCAILISRQNLKKVGLLDPEFFLSFDDYDLCLRVKKLGLKVQYLPAAIFYHGESITVDKNKEFKYYHWYKSKIRFLIKHMPVTNLISILIIQIFLIVPYRTLVLRDGRFIPFIKGFLWNLKFLNKTLYARTV